MTTANQTDVLLPNGNYVSTHPAYLEETEHPAKLPQDKTTFINSPNHSNKAKAMIIAEDLHLSGGSTNRYVGKYFINNLPITIVRRVDYQAYVNTGKVTELWTILAYHNHKNPTAYTYKTGAGAVKKLQQLG